LKNTRVSIYSGESIVSSEESKRKGKIVSFEEDFKLARSNNRRLKRLLDVAFSIFFVLLFPIHLLLVKRPFSLLKNSLLTLFGKMTWVSYCYHLRNLPTLREGVLAPNGVSLKKQQTVPAENLKMLDYWYAKEYDPSRDAAVILKNYRYLGG
jgi:O-antigen biosynthesis protein